VPNWITKTTAQLVITSNKPATVSYRGAVQVNYNGITNTDVAKQQHKNNYENITQLFLPIVGYDQSKESLFLIT